MPTVQRFEDLQCWQKSRELTKVIYQLTKLLDFSRDFALRDQIRSAAISIMSNIAEGFERDGNREFVQFLSVAKASAGEVRSQLYIALDAGYITEDHFRQTTNLCLESSRLIRGMMRYLKQSEMDGVKFRTEPQ